VERGYVTFWSRVKDGDGTLTEGRRDRLPRLGRDLGLELFKTSHRGGEPDLAVPVTNPFRFFAAFEVELADDEAERIGLAESDDPAVYVTVRTAEVAVARRPRRATSTT
jgi:hypothetical protein